MRSLVWVWGCLAVLALACAFVFCFAAETQTAHKWFFLALAFWEIVISLTCVEKAKKEYRKISPAIDGEKYGSFMCNAFLRIGRVLGPVGNDLIALESKKGIFLTDPFTLGVIIGHSIEHQGFYKDALKDFVAGLRGSVNEKGPWDVVFGELGALRAELLRAHAKFPSNKRMFAALAEEYGELSRALDGDGDVRAEALQVACVAMRIYTEGDAGPLDDPKYRVLFALARESELVARQALDEQVA